MPEAGGKGALYINPSDEHEIAHAMSQLLNDSALNLQLIRHGQQHAQEFTKEKMARQMIDVYTSFV
jgi:glycosyltransferase involved in cell wall biosynthesis